MCSLGLRCLPSTIERNVFRKQKNDVKFKIKSKGLCHCTWEKKDRLSDFPAKLIIYVKNTMEGQEGRNKFKTTYSFNCVKDDINTIIEGMKENNLEITKMFFNNKPYVL